MIIRFKYSMFGAEPVYLDRFTVVGQITKIEYEAKKVGIKSIPLQIVFWAGVFKGIGNRFVGWLACRYFWINTALGAG